MRLLLSLWLASSLLIISEESNPSSGKWKVRKSFLEEVTYNEVPKTNMNQTAQEKNCPAQGRTNTTRRPSAKNEFGMLRTRQTANEAGAQRGER